MAGVILWKGRSLIDGRTPIVAIAVTESGNRKTGDMVQTYILRTGIHPAVAVREKKDGAICGIGPHRCAFAGGDGCYVDPRGYTSVWNAYKRGAYPVAADLAAVGRGRMVRLGTYGDPGAVPVEVWRALVSQAAGRTGYSHQWQRFPELQALVMASADSLPLAREAWAGGWRTYRVADEPGAGEIECPSSRGVRCESCRLCDGAGPARSITIPAHGFRATKARAALAQV